MSDKPKLKISSLVKQRRRMEAQRILAAEDAVFADDDAAPSGESRKYDGAIRCLHETRHTLLREKRDSGLTAEGDAEYASILAALDLMEMLEAGYRKTVEVEREPLKMAKAIRRMITDQLLSKPMRNIAEMEAQTAWTRESRRPVGAASRPPFPRQFHRPAPPRIPFQGPPRPAPRHRGDCFGGHRRTPVPRRC